MVLTESSTTSGPVYKESTHARERFYRRSDQPDYSSLIALAVLFFFSDADVNSWLSQRDPAFTDGSGGGRGMDVMSFLGYPRVTEVGKE